MGPVTLDNVTWQKKHEYEAEQESECWNILKRGLIERDLTKVSFWFFLNKCFNPLSANAEAELERAASSTKESLMSIIL